MIHYSCICRGETILCSQLKTTSMQNFENVVADMLPNIPTHQNKSMTYTSDNYSFHCKVENGILFLCVADPNMGKQGPHSFLLEIKNTFLNGRLAARASSAFSHEFDRDFGQVLQREMETFSKPGAGSGISHLQSQVNEVKGILTQNIEKVLERGDRLDDLMDKTYELEEQSIKFHKTSRSIAKKFWWKNTKMTCLMVCGVLILLTIIIIIILYSTGVFSSSDNSSPKPTTAAP
ncbi:vesicle-associated membrane protein 711 [Octopus sinensis]|nr:vesicle-associated membrane protein 711 [Octopus sinensis]